MQYYISHAWQSLKDFLSPKQRWLTKVIPNHWCDKTELIPQILFACIVDFVEEENGLDQLDFDWDAEVEQGHVSAEYVAKIKLDYTQIKEVYNYIKSDRAKLQANIDSALTSAANTDSISALRDYASAEDHLESMDQWAMEIIISKVGILWT